MLVDRTYSKVVGSATATDWCLVVFTSHREVFCEQWQTMFVFLLALILTGPIDLSSSDSCLIFFHSSTLTSHPLPPFQWWWACRSKALTSDETMMRCPCGYMEVRADKPVLWWCQLCKRGECQVCNQSLGLAMTQNDLRSCFFVSAISGSVAGRTLQLHHFLPALLLFDAQPHPRLLPMSCEAVTDEEQKERHCPMLFNALCPSLIPRFS